MLIYFAVELFGTITTYDARLPTGKLPRPVKLIVAFADEFAVNTMTPVSVEGTVSVALIAVVTFALSTIWPRNVDTDATETLVSVIAEAIRLLVIAVSPILSPVTAPVASLTPVTEPSDGTVDEAPNPRNTTWILEEPVGGASENVRVVPLKLYDSICWRIPPTNIISELVETGA